MKIVHSLYHCLFVIKNYVYVDLICLVWFFPRIMLRKHVLEIRVMLITMVTISRVNTDMHIRVFLVVNSYVVHILFFRCSGSFWHVHSLKLVWIENFLVSFYNSDVKILHSFCHCCLMPGMDYLRQLNYP